jgi:predicted RNase H-like nuclease
MPDQPLDLYSPYFTIQPPRLWFSSTIAKGCDEGATMLLVPYVLGVDAYKGGWVALTLADGSVEACQLYGHISDLIRDHSEAGIIAVDIPIGLPEKCPRGADTEARQFVGPRRSSVFPTPPRAVLEAATYDEALALAQGLGGPGISKQSFALAPKILEVDGAASADERIVEVHPEVSFRAMAGHSIEFPKKSWNGMLLRRRLLEANGILLPDELSDGGLAPAEDVLDTAAAVWTAGRIAEEKATSLPDPPEKHPGGRAVAIWY